MKYPQLKQKLNNLKEEVIKEIEHYFIDDLCIRLIHHPNMDYPDESGCRILKVSKQGFHIHSDDGNNYSLSVANINDLLLVLYILENLHKAFDWDLAFTNDEE